MYVTASGAIMFHAQKVMAKADVATTRFLVWPRRSTAGTVPALGGVVMDGSSVGGHPRSRSRVPTGLQPLREGRALVSASSRLR